MGSTSELSEESELLMSSSGNAAISAPFSSAIRAASSFALIVVDSRVESRPDEASLAPLYR